MTWSLKFLALVVAFSPLAISAAPDKNPDTLLGQTFSVPGSDLKWECIVDNPLSPRFNKALAPRLTNEEAQKLYGKSLSPGVYARHYHRKYTPDGKLYKYFWNGEVILCQQGTEDFAVYGPMGTSYSSKTGVWGYTDGWTYQDDSMLRLPKPVRTIILKVALGDGTSKYDIIFIDGIIADPQCFNPYFTFGRREVVITLPDSAAINVQQLEASAEGLTLEAEAKPEARYVAKLPCAVPTLYPNLPVGKWSYDSIPSTERVFSQDMIYLCFNSYGCNSQGVPTYGYCPTGVVIPPDSMPVKVPILPNETGPNNWERFNSGDIPGLTVGNGTGQYNQPKPTRRG